MKKVKKNCPFCGNEYTVYAPEHQKHICYGSPFIRCNNCMEEIIDGDCVELALTNGKYIPKKIRKSTIIYMIVFGIIYLVFLDMMHFEGRLNKTFEINAQNIVFWIFIIAFYCFPIIKDIISYTQRLDDYEKALFDSKLRLKNHEYMKKLKDHGMLSEGR